MWGLLADLTTTQVQNSKGEQNQFQHRKLRNISAAPRKERILTSWALSNSSFRLISFSFWSEKLTNWSRAFLFTWLYRLSSMLHCSSFLKSCTKMHPLVQICTNWLGLLVAWLISWTAAQQHIHFFIVETCRNWHGYRLAVWLISSTSAQTEKKIIFFSYICNSWHGFNNMVCLWNSSTHISTCSYMQVLVKWLFASTVNKRHIHLFIAVQTFGLVNNTAHLLHSCTNIHLSLSACPGRLTYWLWLYHIHTQLVLFCAL